MNDGSTRLSPGVTRVVALMLLALGGTLLVLTLDAWQAGGKRVWPPPMPGLIISLALIALGVAVDRDRIQSGELTSTSASKDTPESS